MPWPVTTRYLGKAAPRIDGAAKVAGRARFTTDIAAPGMLYGAILRSKWASAHIRAIDLSRARKAPGIVAAIAAREGEFDVRYYGDEIAAVAGTTPQAALDALTLIEVQADAGPFVVKETDAADAASPRVAAERTNLRDARTTASGDVIAAFTSAAAVAEGTFSTQVEIHHPLEPHGSVVAWEGDEMTAWSSSQGVFAYLAGFANALSIPRNKVRVVCEHMGGGFGSKLSVGTESVLCARLAQAAGAPVRLVLSRFEQALAAGNRPSTLQKVRLAADADGKLTAFEIDALGSPGHVASTSTAGGGTGLSLPMPYLYPVPNTRGKQAAVAINAGAACAMRAPGHPPASFAMEGILDELAVKLRLDPVAIRLKNDPSEIRRHEYDVGAERFGWKQKYRPPGSSPGSVKVGVGCAGSAWMSGGRGTEAEIQVNPDGTLEVRVGTQDLGTGSRTVIQVVAAEMLQIDRELVSVRVGDTRFPPSGASGGSTTTASVSPAIYDACENVVTELKNLSSGTDPRGAAWKDACRRLGANPLQVRGRWREGLSRGGAGGVQFAEVEVDTETGFVKIRKILAVQDCGTVVNRLTCESQICGGVIMGIGYALYEERVLDRATGVVLNPNFETYKLPGAADIPDIDVLLLDMPERGVIGVGEPCTVPTAAAIANAVANAIGARVWSLPITPAKVLAALGQVPDSGGTVQLAQKLETAFAALEHEPASAAPGEEMPA
jgi:xanthine dehydrogenase YagR molybdenum-binding subunit